LKENGTIEQFNQELYQIDQRLAGLENPPQELQKLSAKLEQYVNQS